MSDTEESNLEVSNEDTDFLFKKKRILQELFPDTDLHEFDSPPTPPSTRPVSPVDSNLLLTDEVQSEILSFEPPKASSLMHAGEL